MEVRPDAISSVPPGATRSGDLAFAAPEKSAGAPVDTFAPAGKDAPGARSADPLAAAAKTLFREPAEPGGIPPEVIWSFQAPSTCEHPPLLGPEGNIYVRASETAVFALDSKGAVLWQGESTASFGNRPAVDAKGNIYYIDKFGIIDGIRFISYDAKGGKRWEVKQKLDGGMGSYTEDGAPLTMVDPGRNSLLARFQNRIYSLDLDSGKQNWSFSVFDYAYDGIGRLEKGPGGNYYIPCNHDRAIHVLDGGTGKEVRKFPATDKGSSWLGMTVSGDGSMYCTEFAWDSGRKGIRALDGDGRERWFTGGGFEGKPLMGGDDTLYVKRKDGKGSYSLCALDASSGKQKWSKPFTPVRDCEPLVAPDGSVIVKADGPGEATKRSAGAKQWHSMGGDPVSKISCIEPDGRVKWVMEPGFWVYTSLSLDEKSGILYAADNGGGCIGINLKKLNEAVEGTLKDAPAGDAAQPVRIEMGDDFVMVGGIKLPVKRA